MSSIMYRLKGFRVWIYTLLPFDQASYSLVVVVQPINLNSCAFGIPYMKTGDAGA